MSVLLTYHLQGALLASMVFDDEINSWICLQTSWRCTAAEAVGLWSVVLFYVTMCVVTTIHYLIQHESCTAERNEQATRRHTASDIGDDYCMLCLVLTYFFSFAAGCFVWVTAGVHWVHPFQCWQVQLVGSAMLVLCTLLFVKTHVDMGESWSPAVLTSRSRSHRSLRAAYRARTDRTPCACGLPLLYGTP